MSTAPFALSPRPRRAIEAVMPKGVEHNGSATRKAATASAIEAVMPKGVEHLGQVTGVRYPWEAIEAVMPKGVEHGSPPAASSRASGDRGRDAERR